MKFLSGFLLFILAFANAQCVADDDELSCINRIRKRGKLVVGIYPDTPNFSFIDPETKERAGFDIDIAKAIAKGILDDPNKIEFVVVTSAERMSLLQENKLDLVVAQFTIKAERLKFIQFSNVYYVAGQALVVLATSSYDELQDLKGKKIGANEGSTTINNIKRILPNSEIVLLKSLPDGLQALRDGKVDAYGTDDVLHRADRGSTERVFKDFRFVGGDFSSENYGIGISKDCTPLLNKVNAILAQMKKNGDWQRIFDRNIGKPTGLKMTAPD